MKEIAAKIDIHLKRMEADKNINKLKEGRKIEPFWKAGSHASGRFVYVTYVSFQSHTHLTREQAEKYLFALDSGKNIKHWSVIK